MPLLLNVLATVSALSLAAGAAGVTTGLMESSCLADSTGGSGLLQVRKGRLSDEAVVDDVGAAPSRSVSIHIGPDNYPVFEWRRQKSSKQAVAGGLIARKRMVDRREVAEASLLQEVAGRGAEGDGKERHNAIVASLAAALDSVPPGATIDELSTDLHGHDFAAVQAVGQSRLQRVGAVTAEVWDAKAGAQGSVKNSLHQDWLPYMQLLGFSAQANCTNGRKEGQAIGARDCTFVRSA